jgi:hypothetical protein
MTVLGIYMVDKAQTNTLNNGRQAGADEVKRCFPNLRIPAGLTFADLYDVEDLILDWRDEDEPRALELVVTIYGRLMAARVANSAD